MLRTLAVILLAGGLLAAEPLTPHLFTVDAGKDFAFTPRFSGPGLTFGVGSLPDGLTFDPATGTVRGRPGIPGTYVIAITASNRGGTATSRIRLSVSGRADRDTAPAPDAAPDAAPVAAAVPPPPPPPAAPVGGEDEEEDVEDPMLASGSALAPWTDNQRRVIRNWFLPGAASLPAGDFYYRISHVGREDLAESPRTNLVGLDDDVKIGFMLGWSPVRSLTATLQRVNGRDLDVPTVDGEAVQYDTWEVLLQWQVLDQRGVRGMWSGPCDLSVVAGTSWMLRNHGAGDTSVDVGVVAERDLFDDRLRLGVGLWRAGLSAYDAAVGGTGGPDKKFPDEIGAAEDSGTTALGLTARFALGQHWYLLAESAIPVGGWKTDEGPSLATGIAYDTNTHEFAILLSNTANTAFNGVLTGGAKEMALPFFAFSITAYL